MGSKSKKVTKPGLSVLWRRDSALRVSLTNLELLKSLPRRRRVNFGKKKVLFEKKAKKNPIPSHAEKSFTISILKKKKSPTTTTYWLTCHLTKLYSKCI